MRISDWSSDVCSADLTPARFVRTAENADLALAHQFVQRFHHRVVRRVRIGPVGLIEVAIIGLQPRQAALYRGADMFAVERGRSAAARALAPEVPRPRHQIGTMACWESGGQHE